MCRHYYLKFLTEDCLYSKNVITKFGSMRDRQIKAPFYSTQMKHVFCFGYHLTWVVEKVRPFKNVPFVDVWFNSIITIQVLFALIHLTTLDHLQPLRVMPAKLLTLNFLCPFFIIFLSHTNSKHYHVKSTCLLLRNILLRGPLPHIANVENYHLFNLEAKYDTF